MKTKQESGRAGKKPPRREDWWSKFFLLLDKILKAAERLDRVALRLIATIITFGATIDVFLIVLVHVKGILT